MGALTSYGHQLSAMHCGTSGCERNEGTTVVVTVEGVLAGSCGLV